jgi:phospholipase D-like protein
MTSRGRGAAAAGPLDVAAPPRAIALELIAGRGHYERVIRAVLAAHTSVWIATANVKALMVEDGRAAPGRRRTLRRASYVSVLALFDELAARGVELRLLHAELPSRPFRAQLAQHPRLVAGGLALRRCPRVHLKAVIVDGELLYLGSANWTGAGLGARGSGRRNFELGIVTDDAPLLDQVQAMYEQIWTGGECAACKLRALCPGPLSELAAVSDGRTPASPAPPAPPAPPAAPPRKRAPVEPARVTGPRRPRARAARRRSGGGE